MPVPFCLKISAVNSVAGAAPVDDLGTKISFPVSHPSAKGRHGTKATITFAENKMIAPGYTDNVAGFAFLHAFIWN